MKWLQILAPLSLSLFSVLAVGNTASYTGKIADIYIHDRETNPYFGIALQGQLPSNPCGTNLKTFAIALDQLNPHHLSMLLAAQLTSKTVEISNANATVPCRGSLPTFNFVRIKN